MNRVRAHGVELAYERAGAGAPLVFVHGALDHSDIWRPQLDALSSEFDVVAWDEPGAGESEIPPAGFTLADYADCLAALIDSLGIGPAHIAGLSWGGTVVLELYRRHAAMVSSLILADTYAGWKGSLPPAEVVARVAQVAMWLESMPEGPGRNRIAEQATLIAEADLTDVLGQIAVPTLLIWGEDDPRSPLNVADAFLSAIPDADLVVIPQARHMSNVEQPQAFNDAIRRFLRELPERR